MRRLIFRRTKRLRYAAYSKRGYLLGRLRDLLEIYEDILGCWGYQTVIGLEELSYELDVEVHEEELKKILWELVHYHTIMNRYDREELGYKKWRSDRDDLLSSMILLEELVDLSREELEYHSDAQLLVSLSSHYASGDRFTSGMAYRRLRSKSRRSIVRSLRRLRELHLIEVVEGDRYSGYVYEMP